MQDTLQVTDTDQTNDAKPYELSLEQLKQVGGGLGPHDNWALAAVAGPHDNW